MEQVVQGDSTCWVIEECLCPALTFQSCGSGSGSNIQQGIRVKRPEQVFSKYVPRNTVPDRSAAKGFHVQISLGNAAYRLPLPLCIKGPENSCSGAFYFNLRAFPKLNWPWKLFLIWFPVRNTFGQSGLKLTAFCFWVFWAFFAFLLVFSGAY